MCFSSCVDDGFGFEVGDEGVYVLCVIDIGMGEVIVFGVFDVFQIGWIS